jgi:cyclic beta-1,2-glucan synthetase
LEKQIAYLTSPPLSDGEERYERPEKTDRKESLYRHVLRTFDLTNARRSARGLCGIGSCDWNDGFSEIKGESVWLTQFFLLCLERFDPYFDPADRAHYAGVAKELKKALSDHCFKEDRYLRAFFPSGLALGSPSSPYCKIDLLPQSFAVFLQKDDPRAKRAINRAYELLFDRDLLLFHLFTPPYDNEKPFPGYLGGYCPGFRENGGQYTHAAAWGALALLYAGEHQKGFEVLKALNPILHWQKERPVYALEPYCMAGDVYSATKHEGRGGWSQYTGSAGWYLTALLEGLLGYREDEEGFSLHPKPSKEFSSFALTVRKKESLFRIEVSLGEAVLLQLDGKPHENRFLFDKKEHHVKMVLQKEKK